MVEITLKASKIPTELLQQLYSRVPRILSKFDSKIIDGVAIGFTDYGPESVYRQISCSCGEEKLNIKAHAVPRGWLAAILMGSKEYWLGPVIIHCPTCGRDQTLFPAGELRFMHKSPGPVVVALYYPWMHRFNEINELVGDNIEDYFHHITVVSIRGGLFDNPFDEECCLGEI